MATKFCASEITFNDVENPLALFSDEASCNAMEEFCYNHLIYSSTAKKVILTDLDSGKIVYDACHDEVDSDFFDEPADLEMGFNPYEGCYDFDC